MKILGIILPGTLLACVFSSAPLSAATYTLEPAADARIITYSGTLDSQNYQADILSVYTALAQQNIQRTLLRFDLSSLALLDNERVDSATLRLTASTGFGSNTRKPMEIYRVTVPWDESKVSWLKRDANNAWATPGGDFSTWGSQPYSSTTNSPADGQPVDWDVTELVAQWVEQAASNYGLLLRSYDGNGLTFVQRESGITTSRPKLTITTTNGVPPLFVASLGASQVTLSWRGVGNAALQESKSIGPDADWSDSNLPILAQAGASFVSVVLTNGNHFFRLRGLP